MLPTWMLPRALRRSSRKAARPAPTPKRPRRLGVETLESRVVPTVSVLGGLNIDTSTAYTNHALTGSFSVAGQSFSAQSMHVDYNPANGGSISISGGASATVAGHEVDFLFGTEGNAGIVLTGNNFSHFSKFDGSITTPSMTFGTLTLGASNLDVSYLAAQSELSITGSSSATFGSSGANNVAVTLGNSAPRTTPASSSRAATCRASTWPSAVSSPSTASPSPLRAWRSNIRPPTTPSTSAAVRASASAAAPSM